jgi:multidrug resistance efflux pump
VEQGLRPQSDLDQAVIWMQKSKATLDKMKRGVDDSLLEPLRSALEIVRHRTTVELEDYGIRLQQAQGDLYSSQEQLTDAKLARAQTTLKAYDDGIITEGEVNEGDIVELGKPLFTIAPEDGFQMEALVASADIGRIHVGMDARIKLDAYDYQKYGTIMGKVIQVASDSEINDKSQIAGYKVKISLPGDEIGKGEIRSRIKLGITGTAEIITDHDTILSIALRKISRKISIY